MNNAKTHLIFNKGTAEAVGADETFFGWRIRFLGGASDSTSDERFRTDSLLVVLRAAAAAGPTSSIISSSGLHKRITSAEL
jgi:hypothetical protein